MPARQLRTSLSGYVRTAGCRAGKDKLDIMNHIGKRGMTGKHGHHRRGERVPRVELICEYCGKKFYKLASMLRVHPLKYCSHLCAVMARRNNNSKVEMPCAICGKGCTRYLVKQHNRISPDDTYCSRKCYAKARMLPNAKWRDLEYIKNYQKHYQITHRAAINALACQWKKNNRPMANAIQRARRAGGSFRDFPPEQWDHMKRFYKDSCLSCGSKEPSIKLEVDHIIPLSMGGKHTPENIQPLCRSCNASKGAIHIDYRKKRQVEELYPIKIVEI